MPGNTLLCWNCGQSLEKVPRPISRHEQCEACFEALHCCRLCRNYRTDVTGECDDERADPPVNKENANFCDFFKPDAGAFSGKRVDRSRAAQTGLDALFADPASDTVDDDRPADDEPDVAKSDELSKEDDARSRLDDLFRK